MERVFELEDALYEAGVFRNGFRQTETASCDSYYAMTDYPSLDEFLSKQEFPEEIWLNAIEYWLHSENAGPPLKQVAYAAVRYYKMTSLRIYTKAFCPLHEQPVRIIKVRQDELREPLIDAWMGPDFDQRMVFRSSELTQYSL